MQIDSVALFKRWEPLACLRNCGYSWSGEDYPNSKRGLAPDEAALFRHMSALVPLAELAPSGFPSFGTLRATFEMLHRQHGVMGQVQDVVRAAGEASDRWRIRTQDCDELRNTNPTKSCSHCSV